jgi:Domain of unknown function (DUF4190)
MSGTCAREMFGSVTFAYYSLQINKMTLLSVKHSFLASLDANHLMDGYAIAAFVLALLSLLLIWVFWLSIPATVLGIIGLYRIKRKGGRGRKLALAACIIALAALVGWGVYILVLLV